MPTGRCSRTACWAAASERGRPMVIGSTTPGNITISRTGRMMSASGGSGGMDVGARPVRSSDGANACMSATEWLRLVKGNHETAVDGRAAYVAVVSDGQAQATFEASLRDFEAMNGCGPQLRRQYAHAGEDQNPIFNAGLDAFRLDPPAAPREPTPRAPSPKCRPAAPTKGGAEQQFVPA